MILLKQQAFANAVDSNGNTPLHLIAIQEESNVLSVRRIMEALLNFDAKINTQSKDGSTPLHLACQVRNLSNVKYLVSSSFNIKICHSPFSREIQLYFNLIIILLM